MADSYGAQYRPLNGPNQSQRLIDIGNELVGDIDTRITDSMAALFHF
ncbi:hypothetical protein [Asticcacaulis taihuensis]